MTADLFTGVVLPVPAADPLVRGRRADARAHVTVLAPFVPLDALTDGVLDELVDFFAATLRFDLTFTGLARFPDGVSYLTPEPAAAVHRLTHRLHARFPEYRPYGGRFDVVVPHLSVPSRPHENAATLHASVAPLLPLHAEITAAELVLGDEERIVRTLASFDLGADAA